ncbi:tripartite tricarboxylate transporter TctB family protein [Aeromicrobium sp. 179-A 4D2 NHS]|uniref:tripartite tricarboxylate transporter TctB family protein n=1 Tax=Aeromicrobium sp. 179-A 4D2 NHS TaxID=3142375 RepID=UPI0039A28D6F
MTDLTHEQSAPPGATPDRVRGTGWIASKVPLAVAIAIAFVFHLQTKEMEVGSLTEAGPGFWPRVLIVAIIVISVLGFFIDMRDGIEVFELGSTVRVIAGFAALAVFTLMFEQTGSILAGFVFLMLWLKGLNGESWRMSLAISVVAPLASYLLFVSALGVRLPEDIVASLWGGR